MYNELIKQLKSKYMIERFQSGNDVCYNFNSIKGANVEFSMTYIEFFGMGFKEEDIDIFFEEEE